MCNEPKSANFDQKAWAIAHGFEHDGFWPVREIGPNSLKTSLIMLANGFLTAYGFVREVYGRNFNEPKSTDFEQKAWAIAHGFEHG